MPEIAAEAIQGGDGDEVEATSPCLGKQRVQAGALLPRAADTMIREFRDDRPTGALGMLAKGAELILGGLVVRADACVHSDADVHGDADAIRVLRVVVRHGVLLRGWVPAPMRRQKSGREGSGARWLPSPGMRGCYRTRVAGVSIVDSSAPAVGWCVICGRSGCARAGCEIR